MFFDYPKYLTNPEFIIGLWLVFALGYLVCKSNLSIKLKYFATKILMIGLICIPIPLFLKNKHIGTLPILSMDETQAYIPALLFGMIVLILKFYSIQTELIENSQKYKNVSFLYAMLFGYPVPYYVFDPNKLERKRTKSTDWYHIKYFILILIQFFTCWLLLAIIFKYAPIPHDVIAVVLKPKWTLLMLIGIGFVTIMMFMMISNIMSFYTIFYNLIGRYNFDYYSNKPFLSTSISEFWQKWNLWGNDWFFKYCYKPFRRKYNMSHGMATVATFTFSGIIHAYCIALINFSLCWIAFLVFFLNGIALVLEKIIITKFPFLSKIPKPIKWLLTFSYLVIVLGFFGLCFS